jgi:ubiquinone/menaquinone biosynthesis C-methylase UbiE
MLNAVEARGLGCELVLADALALPLATRSHDAACLVQVLEYVEDPVAALREAARVVRPGGAVLAADRIGTRRASTSPIASSGAA